MAVLRLARERCQCQLSLAAGAHRAVLCFARAPAQPWSSQPAGEASQCENRMERCFPVSWKYATTIFNLAGKTTEHGPNVLSECCKSHGEIPSSLVPTTNLEPVINPLLKPIEKDPYKSHKYLLWFMFSQVQQWISDTYGLLAPPSNFSTIWNKVSGQQIPWKWILHCCNIFHRHDCILMSAALIKS